MNAPLHHIKVDHLVDPVEALRVFASANARLWASCQIPDYLDAVDETQAFAERHGVVEMFGNDYVMATISAAFKPYRGLLAC